MSSTTTITSAAKPKAVKKVMAKKPKKAAPSHPTYGDMIVRSVKALNERKGSSKQALLKYILANFNVGIDAKAVNSHLKVALKRAVTGKVLKQMAGTGANGRFRVSDEQKTAKPKIATVVKKAKPATKPTKTAAPRVKKVKTPKKAKSPVANKPTSSKPKKTTTKKPTPKKVKKAPIKAIAAKANTVKAVSTKAPIKAVTVKK